MNPKAFSAACLLCFCTATALRADQTAQTNRDQQLQLAFSQFRLLTPLTNSDGRSEFQTLPLSDPVVIDGVNYYGFRFTVPPRKNGGDFVMAFVRPGNTFNWENLPESGTMPPLENTWVYAPKGRYMGTNQLVPLNESQMVYQSIPANHFKDGQTCLIWMTIQNPQPAMSLEFNFAKLDPYSGNERVRIEKGLGLNVLGSTPITNPVNQHQYIMLRPMTWEESEAKAAELGGHLATVRNQSEEDWIFKTFGSYGGQQRLLWIGLSDRDKKFHFTWSSGESVSYTAWAPGEPNNAGHGEDYAAIYYPNHDQRNKWNDWDTRVRDPINLPMDGIVEIIPTNAAAAFATNSRGSRQSGPGSRIEGATATGASGGGSAESLQAIQITPALVITNLSGRITLQWPVSAANYMLEATTNMSEPFTMFGYSELTNAEAGVVYVTISNPVPQMFFRLRKPDAP